MALFSRSGEMVHNIHNDLAKAQAAGLERPIAQGQLLLCLMSSLVEDVFGASWASGGHIIAKFLRPVPAFSDITIGGAVHEVTMTSGRSRAELDLWVVQDGKLSAVAWAEVDVPEGRPARISLHG
jgi:acyl dehydratase